MEIHKIYYLMIFLLISFITVNLNAETDTSALKEGDIIFQESLSEQAIAIKSATHSRYTHVGIIFKYGNRYKVLEAVQPVKITELDVFINRGVDHHYIIKRLKNYKSLVKKNDAERMKKIGNSYIGRDYDIYFEWSDERIYCTELVWKIYKKTFNVEIGRLEQLKDFDLSDPSVKKLMKKRYGNKIPYQESVISPESMFNSENLIQIESGTGGIPVFNH
jgi:hypothetical protein